MVKRAHLPGTPDLKCFSPAAGTVLLASPGSRNRAAREGEAMGEMDNAGALGQAALANILRFGTSVDIQSMLQFDPQNLAALHTVLTVLGDPRTTNIAFELPNVKVSSTTFSDVRSAMRDGRIRVFAMLGGDPDAAVSDGVYVSGGNYMKIAPNPAQPLVRKAKIAHESVHASHDIDKRSELFVRESEMAAYIAEAVFLRHCYPKAQSRPNEMRPTNFIAPGAPEEAMAQQAEDILKAAWDCAVQVTGGAPVLAAGSAPLRALESAIVASDLYSGNHADHILADGAR